MRRLLITALLLAIVPIAVAQVYKWTDAQGVVHYTDAAPPTGIAYKNVKTNGTVEAPVPAASPKPALPAAKPAAPGSVQDTPENRSKLCTQLQANMDLLGKDAPLTVDDSSGNRVAVDADRRRQELGGAQAQYKQYCAK